jgi:hypothetical protein
MVMTKNIIALYIEMEGYDYLLIVDLASICCDKNTIPKGKHEIIEIGPSW